MGYWKEFEIIREVPYAWVKWLGKCHGRRGFVHIHVAAWVCCDELLAPSVHHLVT